MKVFSLPLRSVVIHLLVLALVCAAVQAKIGLYHPERSPARITSQTIKIVECRIERVTPELPVEIAIIPISDLAHAEPDPVDQIEAALPPPPELNASHWFRPPPELL